MLSYSFYVCVQLAAMRVQLIQLKDEMEDCVQKEEFQQAAELKRRIAELELSRQSLMNSAMPQTTEVRVEKVSDPQHVSLYSQWTSMG